MDVTTLPVHYFTEMTEYEITNRMDCLIKFTPESCMKYCEMVAEKEKEKQSKLEDCYKEKKVPSQLYGLAKCNNLYPSLNSLSAKQYLACLVSEKITVDRKNLCKYLFHGDDTKILSCWNGWVLNNIGTEYILDLKSAIPIDFDYVVLN